MSKVCSFRGHEEDVDYWRLIAKAKNITFDEMMNDAVAKWIIENPLSEAECGEVARKSYMNRGKK